MAAAATPPARTSVALEGRLAETAATTTARSVTPTSHAYACPAEEESSVDMDTPTVARSARSVAIAPRNEAPPAEMSSACRRGTSPPNARLPVAAAPTSSERPAYSRILPTTLSGDGPGVVGTEVDDRTGPAGTPTPNAKAPAVKWRSTCEQTLHDD